MHIPLASLTSLLLHFDFSFSDNDPQVPLTYGPTTEANYGYAGPGVIVSSAIPINTPPPVDNDNAQQWLIADVSATEKMLINNGTGAILSAIKGTTATCATSTPPYELKARWTIDSDKYSDFPGSPIMLKNVGKKTNVLDLSNSQKQAGTPVLSYPMHSRKAKNQAWLLEYLESPPPAPPTPAPPAPGPCEYPEADQKALRGDVVPECDKFRFANTVTRTAQECYDEMKVDAETYNIQSYVFTSFAEPGSPDGQGGWGDCTGYQARSYRFFVGNSTGSGFGGDLGLPYSQRPRLY